MRFIFAIFALVFSHSVFAQVSLDAKYEELLQFVRSLPSANDKAAAVLRQDLSDLLSAAGEEEPVEMVITTAPLIGQAFPGRVLAVHEDLASQPRAHRLFVLGHELGHVLMNHHHAVNQFMAQVPAKLSDSELEVMEGRARPMFHAKEFDADAFSAKLLRRMNVSIAAAAEVLKQFGDEPATITHPAIKLRVQRLLKLHRSRN